MAKKEGLVFFMFYDRSSVRRNCDHASATSFMRIHSEITTKIASTIAAKQAQIVYTCLRYEVYPDYLRMVISAFPTLDD